MKNRYIILEDGTVFEGIAFGADRCSIGELVFTTGMCGYIETLTDPSYFGQIVVQTFPMIGNYGIIESDFEGECALYGYIVREWCEAPSNFRCQYDLDSFLKKNNIPGVCNVDTREITKIIREHGVTNAMLSDSPDVDLTEISLYKITDAVRNVTTEQKHICRNKNSVFNVALIDCGAKKNIVNELIARGCSVTVYLSFSSAEEILADSPDGLMLSNGPGDPEENTKLIAQIKKLVGKLPIFGICLGHQLLALALGGKTEKLKYGHRGVNQPVTELKSNKTFITSQNHGYAVVNGTVSKGVLSFINSNDNTCEGIDYPDLKAFSVQFHPEACSGPHDTSFLFDKFISLMEGGC